MTTHRRLYVVALVVAVVALVGSMVAFAFAANRNWGPWSPAEGAPGAAAGQQRPGPGMMGDGSSYHYSQLTCSAPSARPGTTVTVVLADMGMTQMMAGDAPMGARMTLRATPATVPAGQVSFVAENMGWRTHELVIMPLAGNSSAGQRVPAADGKVDETGNLGEASASCGSGAGEGIESGSVGWTTVNLPAGRYELMCNLTNHYADGMHQEIDVVG